MEDIGSIEDELKLLSKKELYHLINLAKNILKKCDCNTKLKGVFKNIGSCKSCTLEKIKANKLIFANTENSDFNIFLEKNLSNYVKDNPNNTIKKNIKELKTKWDSKMV
tara:strand:- start:2355 stop:2681 length:327 start_codon:yes stop_codon:yes gene_type:complete